MMVADDKIAEPRQTGVPVSSRFLVLLLLGLTLTIIGMAIVLVAAGISESSVSFGGVIFIGPFPILIGVGPDWHYLLAIGIAIAILSMVLFVIMRRRF